MSKNLVIVESPAKAKTIEKYLGKDYSVLASMGHLRDLPEKTLGVDMEKDFAPKYQTIKGKSELIKSLKKEAEISDKVYLATDPDREGEAISWHIANILGIKDDEVCRVTFNEITKNAVTEAIDNPRMIDKDLVDAQQARRVLDRIVGYGNLSPLLWKKIRKGLSAGRVQSVATRIVCDREEEIEKFIPEEYWTIKANLNTSDNSNFIAKLDKKDGKKLTVKNESEAKEILSVLKTADYVIENIKESKKIRKPYPPFITSTLQQQTSRKLNFTSKRTMQTAQNLYEGINVKGKGLIGLITYMRTDSLRISDDAKKNAKSFILANYGSEFCPKGYNEYKMKKGNVQDAHEAIRPSDVFLTPDAIKDSLTSDQYKLYKLIWERFVASQMVNAIFNATAVEVSADCFTLKATGQQMIFEGFMKLYIESTDNKEEDEDQNLPHLTEGEKLKLKKLTDKQNFTAPPSRYTEASLIKIMEEYGIGRPSTYAPTISTILQREYIVKEGKSLVPTELGKVTTKLMKENFKDIVDVKFTAGMEDDLDSIEHGNNEWVQIIRDFYKDFEVSLNKAQDIDKVKVKEEETDEICDKCGRKMVIKTGKFGKFLACPGFPECKNAKPITTEVKDIKCPICQGKVLAKKSKRGKKYFGCENNPECSFMTWDEPTNEKCEKCGNVMVKKYYGRGSKLYCSNQECENAPKKRVGKKNENS